MTNVIVSPRLAATASPLNEDQASLVDMLQELLADVRAGTIRSLACVAVFSDGTGSPTRWSIATGDQSNIVGMLETLKTDLITSRS